MLTRLADAVFDLVVVVNRIVGLVDCIFAVLEQRGVKGLFLAGCVDVEHSAETVPYRSGGLVPARIVQRSELTAKRLVVLEDERGHVELGTFLSGDRQICRHRASCPRTPGGYPAIRLRLPESAVWGSGGGERSVVLAAQPGPAGLGRPTRAVDQRAAADLSPHSGPAEPGLVPGGGGHQ